jgi:hypothetical protein
MTFIVDVFKVSFVINGEFRTVISALSAKILLRSFNPVYE